MFVSRPKEPNFFSDADQWRRVLGWYTALFDEASSDLMAGVTRPDNPLVGTSCYYSRLSPYIDRFPREQICVVRFEDLVDDGGDGWDEPPYGAALARISRESINPRAH